MYGVPLGSTVMNFSGQKTLVVALIFDPAHDKTYKMACAPSVDSDQPWHLPILISVFAVRTMGS